MTKKRNNRSKVSGKQVATSMSVTSVDSKENSLSANNTPTETGIIKEDSMPVSNVLKDPSEEPVLVNSNEAIKVSLDEPVKVNDMIDNLGDAKPVPKKHDKKNTDQLITPKLVGKFIDDQKHKNIVVEDFEWRRLYEPNLKKNFFDLNQNIETFEHNPLYYEKIDPLLKYILKATEEGTSLRDAIHKCELVTRRSVLVKIGTFNTMTYFHDEKVYCELTFCKFNGVIFACEHYTEQKRLKALPKSKKQKQLNYWGHNFEKIMTTEAEKEKPDLDEPVSTLSPQYGVFKTQLTDLNNRKLDVFFNGIVDAIDGEGKFIDFKTADRSNPQHQSMDWEKANKSDWWLQCALGNIERVIVGIRNWKGIVTELEDLHVPKARRNDDEKQTEWKYEDCINSLLDFYDEVRELLDSKPEGALLKVELIAKPEKEIKKTWIDDNERDKYEFLLPEFIDRFSPAE